MNTNDWDEHESASVSRLVSFTLSNFLIVTTTLIKYVCRKYSNKNTSVSCHFTLNFALSSEILLRTLLGPCSVLYRSCSLLDTPTWKKLFISTRTAPSARFVSHII